MVEDQVNKSEQQTVKSDGISTSLEEQEQVSTPLEIRQYVCRTANAIRALSTLGFIVTVEVVVEIVNLSSFMNLDVHEMLGSEFCVLVAEKEVERRTLTKKKGWWVDLKSLFQTNSSMDFDMYFSL